MFIWRLIKCLVKIFCDYLVLLPSYSLHLRSVILQQWTSSSAIVSRTNCCFSFECSRPNWSKKHNNASRKTHSFLKVKIRPSLKKTWTKINMIFVIKKQHTVNTLCLQFNIDQISGPGVTIYYKLEYGIKVSIIFTVFTEYFNLWALKHILQKVETSLNKV